MLNSLAACSSHCVVARARLVLVLILSLLASWLIVPSIAPSPPAAQAPVAQSTMAQPVDTRGLAVSVSAARGCHWRSILWRWCGKADCLGVIGQGRSTATTQARDSAPQIVGRSENDRVLHYANAWTDPSIAEEIVSADGGRDGSDCRYPDRASAKATVCVLTVDLEKLK